MKRSIWNTAAVAIASSLTTALLFTACSVDLTARVDPTATTSAPPSAAATPVGSPTAALRPAVSVAGAQPQAQAATSTNPAVGVYQRNGASVVNITSLAVVRGGQAGQSNAQPQGTGSGFIIDTDGRIVTNNHVVAQADQLTVTFQDRTTVPATLLGRDPDNDLAVIQVDVNSTDDQGKPIRDRVKPVVMGDSDKLTVGEDAIAIGSPLGLQQTVTSGIVSALRNPGEDNSRGQLDLLGGAVQTDASINPGNSGGPLFNAAGEVIGVNSAILSQSGGNEGIGFAIPINVVKRVTPELIQNGRYAHPLVGITSIPLSQLSASAKQLLGVGATQKGLLVQEVTAGAAQAGIQAGGRNVTIGTETLRAGGDLIVAIDGRPVVTGGDLRGYVENNKRPGDTVKITVSRNGQQQDFTVTLTERPVATQ